jgi:hypothetical protein
MADDMAKLLQGASEDFDRLCQERHEQGQKEYGAFTFMGNDVIRMMAEELADTANYCRYQYMKLMILQEALITQIGDQPKPVEDLGLGSFKGVGEAGWDK